VTVTRSAPCAVPTGIDRLLALMARLRHPVDGCPWDREQTFSTVAPYTVEEAYEVADAIAGEDWPALREELGDLLFQVVFHARMAEEAGHFDFDSVAQAIVDKMIARHPHVFPPPGQEDGAARPGWEDAKARERAAKGAPGVLDGIARTLPPLTRALKLQARAARVGFDWDDPADILRKIDEEADELGAEISAGSAHERLEDEMGDLLFVCVNLARKLSVDPDLALRRANAKFERRFGHIEAELRRAGRSPEAASLDEMEALWQAAKRLERTGGTGAGG
jgi:MazG family protein